MSIVRRNLITAIWVLAIMAGGVRAASAQVVLADVNGDGVSDRIEAASTGTELLVRTSTRRHPQRLRTRDHIVRVAVADVNRDGRADIIVSTRRSGLQVWLNTGHGRFRPARPRAPASEWRSSDRSGKPTSAANDDGDLLGAQFVVSSDTRTPTPDAVFQPFRPAHASFSFRSIRPRVPRGPPHVPALS
jgi:hypothetical protein